MFGPPGSGKCHLALRFALVENGWRVLFTRITDPVQRQQIARRELALESAIAKLDKYHLLILDDLAFVTKDQAETSVRVWGMRKDVVVDASTVACAARIFPSQCFW